MTILRDILIIAMGVHFLDISDRWWFWVSVPIVVFADLLIVFFKRNYWENLLDRKVMEIFSTINRQK